MATAKKLPSGSWRCQVFSHYEEIPQPDGTIKKKRIYKSFTCDDPTRDGKKTCERMAAEWAERKENVNATVYTMTFKQALNQYINERSSILSPASIRKYRSMQKNKFIMIDDIPLANINNDIIQKYINEISKTMSPKSVRDINGLITAVIKRNMPERVINATLPKKVRTNIYVPSEDEIKILVKSIKGTDMEIPVMLAAFGALRRGEICALLKSDIVDNSIHVSKTMVYTSDNKWIIKAPKSYAGDRFVTVPEFVLKLFRDLPDESLGMTPNMITSKFEHVLKRAGLPHFRFHDLRHYNASIKHALGIPDAYIMTEGGWGNDRVLKEVYRHTLESTRKKMNDVAMQYFESMQHDMQHEKEKA